MYTTLARISLGLCWVAITTGIVICFVIFWPTKHFRVLKIWFVFACLGVPGRLGIFQWWFFRRGENRTTQKMNSLSKDEDQEQWIQCTCDVALEIRIQTTLGGKFLRCSYHFTIFDSPRSTTPSIYERLHCFAIPRKDLSIRKTNQKYRNITRKPRSHVRILTYRAQPRSPGPLQLALRETSRRGPWERGWRECCSK